MSVTPLRLVSDCRDSDESLRLPDGIDTLKQIRQRALLQLVPSCRQVYDRFCVCSSDNLAHFAIQWVVYDVSEFVLIATNDLTNRILVHSQDSVLGDNDKDFWHRPTQRARQSIMSDIH
jgi:hypothetical protein